MEERTPYPQKFRRGGVSAHGRRRSGDLCAMIVLLKVLARPGLTPVVRSIDMSRRASGTTTGGVDHLILCGQGTGLATRPSTPPFSSRSSRYAWRGADRKSSFLVPTARLEVHNLADGPPIAHSLGNSSLYNTSGTLNFSHCYLSHLTNVTFDWLAPYPASLKRSTLGSNRDRKTAASIGSSKQ
jgi:hypothetical protein